MNFVSDDLAEGSASGPTPRTIGTLILLLAVASLAGCRTYLMATPNLYVNFRDDPFAKVAEEFREPFVDVIYATDRKPTVDSGGKREYGYERSTSLAFGTCRVTLGDDWDTLARASRTHWRSARIPLKVEKIECFAHFPRVPRAQSGAPADQGESKREYDGELKRQQRTVNEALAKLLGQERQTQEAFIYIHGVNTSFNDAAMVMAQLWHFMGRQGVPMIYSWPARRGGIFEYGYDRESGEFTIFHLKQFLRTIARCEKLKKIHLIAHSRGTDVLLSALRELHIENRFAGHRRLDLKIGQVILAAPDIDIEVSSQRMAAEQLQSTCEHITVYLSQDDRVIAFARWLFSSSVGRLGWFQWNELTAVQKAYLKSLEGFLTFVDATVKTDFIGHAYFYRNPAVSSDLILRLRDNLDAGSGRRSLERKEAGSNFWEIVAGYPKKK